MKRITVLLMALTLTFTMSTAAMAALHYRGGGLIYDNVLNITWMQQANYAGVTMTWDIADNWVSTLAYQGYTDWRLPMSDTACSGKDCTGSELGHLYSIDNITSGSFGPFIDVRPYMYWSVSDTIDSTKAWRYNLSTGTQGKSSKTLSRYVWAVRNGDSSPPMAPEPVSTILFISGGAVLGFGKMRKRNRQSHA